MDEPEKYACWGSFQEQGSQGRYSERSLHVKHVVYTMRMVMTQLIFYKKGVDDTPRRLELPSLDVSLYRRQAVSRWNRVAAHF